MKATRLLYFTPLLAALLLIGVFAIGLFTHEETAPSPLLQKPLPEFSLPLLEGEGSLSNQSLKGRYTLLNIFASWCISCQIEHKLLMQIGEYIPVYGLAWKDKPENTSRWLEQHGNPYVAVGMDIKGNTAIDFGITGAPETFLVSPDGKVLFRYAGPLTKEVVKESILPLVR